MIYMRGQARRLRRLAPARPRGLGLGRRPAVLQASRRPPRRRERAARRRRRVARRAPAPVLADPRRGRARRRPKSASPKSTTSMRGDNEGCDYFEVNQRRGRRWSAARGFLGPSSTAPICASSPAPKPNGWSSKGAAPSACATRKAGEVLRRAPAGEIVLAAGAIGTPQLLELSGVGRPDVLAGLGHRGRARAARRRREPAGPSAVARPSSAFPARAR